MEQPALRRYGQELPELRQNAVSTEICRPQKKVLEKEVWSQEAQATIETDIGGLQPLREYVRILITSDANVPAEKLRGSHES